MAKNQRSDRDNKAHQHACPYLHTRSLLHAGQKSPRGLFAVPAHSPPKNFGQALSMNKLRGGRRAHSQTIEQAVESGRHSTVRLIARGALRSGFLSNTCSNYTTALLMFTINTRNDHSNTAVHAGISPKLLIR